MLRVEESEEEGVLLLVVSLLLTEGVKLILGVLEGVTCTKDEGTTHS